MEIKREDVSINKRQDGSVVILAPYIQSKHNITIFKSSAGWLVCNVLRENKTVGRTALKPIGSKTMTHDYVSKMVYGSNMYSATSDEARRVINGEVICPITRASNKRNRGAVPKFIYLPK